MDPNSIPGSVGGYVYILKSLKSGRFYIGSTENLIRRIREHRAGKTNFVSRYIGEFSVVFEQKYDDISMARKIEKWLKSQKDKDFLRRIIEERKILKVM